MAKRKVIRQVEAQAIADFDDQLWPINCALLVFAGFVAGNIIATSDFDTPNLLQNGWTRLATLGLVLVGLLLGTFYLKRKRYVRRMQLAVLLSLLVHLWLGMGLRMGYLAIRPEQDREASEWVDETQLVTLPDYGQEPTDQLSVEESLTSPVETDTPESDSQPVERQAESERPVAPQAAPAESTEQAVTEASRAQMERAETSAPRHSDQLSGRTVSRQPLAGASTPSETVPVPEATQAAAAPSPMEASQRAAERMRTSPDVARTQVEENTQAATSPTRSPQVARQTREDQPQSAARSDAPTRATAQSPTVEQPTELAVETANARPTERAELEPAASPTRAQSAPTPTTANMEAPADAPSAVARSAPQRRPADARPTLARTEDAPDRARQAADSAATAATTEVAAVESNAPTDLQPADAPTSRRQAAAAPQAESAVAADTAPNTATSAAVQSQAQRADSTADAPSDSPATSAVVARSRSTAPSQTDAAESAEMGAAGPAGDAPAQPEAGALATTRQSSAAAPGATSNAGASAGEPASTASARVARSGSRNAAVGAAEPTTEASGGASLARATTAASGAGDSEAAELAQTSASSGGPAGGPSESESAGGTSRASTPNITATGGASGAAATAGDAPQVIGTTGRRAAAGQAAADGPQMNAGSAGTIARAQTGLGQTAGDPAAEPVEVAAAAGDGAAAGGLESGLASSARGSTAAGPAAAGTSGSGEPAGDPAATAVAGGVRSRAVGQDAPALAMADGDGAPGRASRNASDAIGGELVADAGPVATASAGSTELAESSGGGSARGQSAAPAAAVDSSGDASGGGTASGPQVASRGGAARRDESAPEAGGIQGGTGPARASSASAAVADDGGVEGIAELAAGSASQPAGATETNTSSGRMAAAGADVPTDANGGSDAAGESSSPSPGALAGRRRSDEGDSGPQPGDLAGSGDVAKSGGSAIDAIDALVDDIGPMSGDDANSVAALDGTGGDGSARRPAASSAVELAALTGPGGLSEVPGPELGLPNRLARPQSEVVTISSGRFVLKKSGGLAAIAAEAVEPAPAFKQRMPAERGRSARSRGGSEGSEKAVEMGLDFLARHQSADGHWSLHDFAAGRTEAEYQQAFPGQMQADTAATGLAMLSFLGAGYTHQEGKYRDVVEGGLAWLIAHQKDDGDLFSGGSKYVWLYSHGIASIALCEAYGMTRDDSVRGPAQRALEFIAAAQHPTQGGWRYAPQTGSDTSVSGWQMMALKSGELAGLEVASSCYPLVTRWLDHAQGTSGDPSRYAYRPTAEHRHQREPSRTMTAEALLMRMYLGWGREHQHLSAGADFLRQNLPEVGTRQTPLRDAYYWYYATQVMYQVGGDRWEAWNGRLRDLLVTSQEQSGPLAGSWNPKGAVPDRWGAEAGRIYSTCMHLLMLEVYYRHLPLYQTLASEDAAD